MNVDTSVVAAKISGTKQRLYVLLAREYGEEAAKSQYHRVTTELNQTYDLADCSLCGVWERGVESVNGQPVCWECEPELWK